MKNKDASEECGNVTIISEENEIFSIDTRKKTKRMKGDFKQGNIVKVSPELQTLQDEIDTFCTTICWRMIRLPVFYKIILLEIKQMN